MTLLCSVEGACGCSLLVAFVPVVLARIWCGNTAVREDWEVELGNRLVWKAVLWFKGRQAC